MLCKLVIIQSVNVCRILKKKESIFIPRPQKIRFFKFIGPRGQGNKLIINRYKATTILAQKSQVLILVTDKYLNLLAEILR